MKYLKLFEDKRDIDISSTKMEPEILAIIEYFKYIVEKTVIGGFRKDIRCDLEVINDTEKTFTLILDTWQNYFIFKCFCNKEDDLWIKSDLSVMDDLKNEILKLNNFFDIIAKDKKPDENYEYGWWCFDRNTFMLEIENIDMYINAGKYNL